MQSVEKKKQIAFLGTEEYRAELQQQALNRGIKVQGLLEAAVDSFLSAAGSAKPAKPDTAHDPAITPQGAKERELVRALLACLRDKRRQMLLPAIEKLLAWSDQRPPLKKEKIS